MSHFKEEKCPHHRRQSLKEVRAVILDSSQTSWAAGGSGATWLLPVIWGEAASNMSWQQLRLSPCYRQEDGQSPKETLALSLCVRQYWCVTQTIWLHVYHSWANILLF